MKAFFWTNMYLSPIQHGIQCQHCTVEMFLKYQKHSKQKTYLLEWANNHKTTIVLNGGFYEDLISKYNMFQWYEFPFAHFEEPGLGVRVITCVGIILPEAKPLELEKLIETSHRAI